jgi:chemotaxis protein MotB
MSGQLIIIKKVKKSSGGHHGGAWKVAYADFVTAMMAFFLLLWLLNAVSQDHLKGISDYFAPHSTTKATTGGGGLLAGKSVSERGVFDAELPRSLEKAVEFPLVEIGKPLDRTNDPHEDPLDEDHPAEAEGMAADPYSELTPEQRKEMIEREREVLEQELEEAQFREAREELEDLIDADPELKLLAESLTIEMTPDGMLIHIADQEGLPMFAIGDTEPLGHTRRIFETVADVISKMPQDVSIAGHTDSLPFSNGGSYTNWELSTDRANAARRTLLEFGVPETRIERVVGQAATNPILPEDPKAARNRRVSVLLLRESAAPPG